MRTHFREQDLVDIKNHKQMVEQLKDDWSKLKSLLKTTLYYILVVAYLLWCISNAVFGNFYRNSFHGIDDDYNTEVSDE